MFRIVQLQKTREMRVVRTHGDAAAHCTPAVQEAAAAVDIAEAVAAVPAS